MDVLTCRGLRKEFGDHVVLDGLDLTVGEHQVVALIGASGSGKSTLLRCVNLLEDLDDGVIELDGEDISDPRVDPDRVRRRIGMVFQSYNLFPHLSVLENITLAPIRVHRRPRAEAEAQAWSCSTGWASARRRTPTRTGSPAGSSSAWRWPARWPTRPASCCWTR